MTSNIKYIRLLRTPSSERLLLQAEGTDIGALEIHYEINGRVAATLILLENAPTSAQDIDALIADIDEIILPNVSREDGNVVFTVVKGTILGSFVGGESDTAAEPI